jgi:hypothetical protein
VVEISNAIRPFVQPNLPVADFFPAKKSPPAGCKPEGWVAGNLF